MQNGTYPVALHLHFCPSIWFRPCITENLSLPPNHGSPWDSSPGPKEWEASSLSTTPICRNCVTGFIFGHLMAVPGYWYSFTLPKLGIDVNRGQQRDRLQPYPTRSAAAAAAIYVFSPSSYDDVALCKGRERTSGGGGPVHVGPGAGATFPRFCHAAAIRPPSAPRARSRAIGRAAEFGAAIGRGRRAATPRGGNGFAETSIDI